MLQSTEPQVTGTFGCDQSAPTAFGGTKSSKKAPDSGRASWKEHRLELSTFTCK